MVEIGSWHVQYRSSAALDELDRVETKRRHNPLLTARAVCLDVSTASCSPSSDILQCAYAHVRVHVCVCVCVRKRLQRRGRCTTTEQWLDPPAFQTR